MGDDHYFDDFLPKPDDVGRGVLDESTFYDF